MQNILTPAMVINFDPSNKNFAGITIAAAGVVSDLAAGTLSTIKSSDTVTSHSNKVTEGSIGFIVQTSTEYTIVLVAKELKSQNTHTEFQRYGSLSTFVDDSKAKIFDLRTLGFSIKDGMSTFTLSEEKTTASNYIIQVTKDADVDYTLKTGVDCVSFRVTASKLGQLTLSTTLDGTYEQNELLIPTQCGESIAMNVFFKPITNEILDGDRTFTLTHKVATATGRFYSLNGATLASSVSVTLTDNDKGSLELETSSKEFDEGSSLSLKLSLSAAPPSGDKITVSLAKGSQDEGVKVSPSKVVFCCLDTSTLIPCIRAVEASLQITGYSKVEFDEEKQTAFKTGMSEYLGVGFGAISITSFTDDTARRKLSAVDSVLKVEFTVEATTKTLNDITTNIETKLIVTDTTEMTTTLKSAGLSSISNIVAPTAVAALKDPAGSIGFTVQPSTDYAIILVAKELISQNTHEEFQRYASSTTFVDDEKAKIFDARTLGFSIKDGKSTFTLSEEDDTIDEDNPKTYIVQVTKDTESGVTLGALDCVSILVTASMDGQLKLSTASDGKYVENEIRIPASSEEPQCGNSIKIEVHFKPIKNEILDGDRTITLTHKVATATGQFKIFDGATLKASVSVALTDDEKGALDLDPDATSKEFNEGSSLPLNLSLSTKPPSGDKITVSLAKGSQDEGVEVSPSKVVFCCLEESTLIPCTTATAAQKNCCICQKVIETDADVLGYLWSYKVPIKYTSTEDDGEAAANKIVSLTATAASALTAYNGVTTTVEGITVIDIHSAGARMSPAELELTEGGTDAKVTIELTSKPNAGVTLKLEDSSTTDSALLSFSPSTVTFSATSATDWKTPREVRVTYPRDYKVKDVTKKINVRLSGTTADTTGYGTKDGVAILFLRESLVTVSVTNVDTAAFVFTPSAGTFNEDGGIFSYAVKLATIPDGNVTVTPQPKGDLEIIPSSITLKPETARTNADTFQVKSKERDYIDIGESLSHVIKHLTTTDDEDNFMWEAFYSIPVSDSITVTPAIFGISPYTSGGDDDIFGAFVKTTFKF
jgi:hypothetical protein